MALKERLEDLEKAFERLREAYIRAHEDRFSDDFPYFRDSAIQRFEFTVEILWKSVKDYLREKEGLDCASPKGCLRELQALGYLEEDEGRKLLEMIDYRNLTSHTYREEVAQEIFRHLGEFLELMEKVLAILRRG